MDFKFILFTFKFEPHPIFILYGAGSYFYSRHSGFRVIFYFRTAMPSADFLAVKVDN